MDIQDMEDAKSLQAISVQSCRLMEFRHEMGINLSAFKDLMSLEWSCAWRADDGVAGLHRIPDDLLAAIPRLQYLNLTLAQLAGVDLDSIVCQFWPLPRNPQLQAFHLRTPTPAIPQVRRVPMQMFQR